MKKITVERTRSVSVRGLLFWIVLVTQVLVPVLQLDAPRPSRFGWQMFSGVGRPAEFDVELTDGIVEPVDVDRLLARPRPEMNLPETLPPLLCQRFPAADAVRVRELLTGLEARRVRCR